MYGKARELIKNTLDEIEKAGLFKEERVLLSPQGATIKVKAGEVLNFCANNYLGLSGHPEFISAARAGLDERGFGLSSVRFICGTQDIHKELEQKISAFLGTDDTILYTSCFDANGGLFETLAAEGRRDHQRRAEPCQHHRRRSPLQGPTLRYKNDDMDGSGSDF